MSPLAAAAAQHNAAEDEKESQYERNDVAEARKQRSRVGGRWKYGIDHSGGAPRKRLHDVAAAVDHGADSRRRGAQDGDALLGGAEPRLGEVLRRSPAAEPGVVRRIEDESGAVLLVDHMARENDLVAEIESDLAP